MNTRPVGSTGIQASVVGVGCEHLDNKPYEVTREVISAALDNGINIIDLFMPGAEVRGNVGRALRGRRDKMLIQGHLGSVEGAKKQYDITRDLNVCKRYFEDLLRCLDTDYIDFGMLFFVDTHKDIDLILNNRILEYVRQLKKSGKVRAIGASAHNPDTARRLVEEGLVEMLMFSVNPAFDMSPDMDINAMLTDGYASYASGTDPARAELYRLCQSKGVGITVMKPLLAGRLLSAEHSLFARAMTPAQCIHYVLTRPAVASALVGCKSREEVESAARYCEASDAEKDFSETISRFREGGKGGFKGNCVYCNHCQPCPAGIDVAQVNKYLDIASLDEKEIPPSIAQHYRSLEAHASDCLRCGSCEKRCPFSVPVIRNMEKAARLFGC